MKYALAILAALSLGCAFEAIQFPGGEVSGSASYVPPAAVRAEGAFEYDLAGLLCQIPYASFVLSCPDEDDPEAQL